MVQVGAANYSEKLLVGYRWFDAMHLRPAFCFGHGESYSKFAYRSIKVGGSATKAFTVNFTLVNTGAVEAAEIAQLYVSFPVGAGEPLRQLKGAQKVLLAPGGTTEVSFVLTAEALSVWNAEQHGEPHGWRGVPGQFGLFVGASSCDLRLNTTLQVPEEDV